MQKSILVSVLFLFTVVSWLNADLVAPRQADTKQRIMGQGNRPYVDIFKANERAIVAASGNGKSCLALYVFDSSGNCVAADDRSDPATGDDCAVEWYPATQAKYSIEVRNLGSQENTYRIRMR